MHACVYNISNRLAIEALEEICTHSQFAFKFQGVLWYSENVRFMHACLLFDMKRNTLTPSRMGKRTEMESVYTWIVCLVRICRLHRCHHRWANDGRYASLLSTLVSIYFFFEWKSGLHYDFSNSEPIHVLSFHKILAITSSGWIPAAPWIRWLCLRLWFSSHRNFFSVRWMNTSNSAPKTKWINSDKCMCLVSNFLPFVPQRW